MENGKRMEFNGVAIVILAIVMLMITGITTIEAFSVKDCPNCPELGIEFRIGQYYPDSLHCSYSSSIDPFSRRDSGGISIIRYCNRKLARSRFEDKCKLGRREVRNRENVSSDILSDNDTKFVYMVHGEEFSKIYGYFLHTEKKIVTDVRMTFLLYPCANNSDIAKERFNAFAKCAHSITGWKDTETEEKYTLTLKHYPPFYESKKGKPWKAGDLVATLTDKNGKGVSDKTVFFYVEPGTNLKGVLENFHPLNKWIRIRHNFPGVSYVGYAHVHKGIARWNYIDNGCIRLDVLTKRFRETGKSIKGAITAVVLDEKTNKIEQKASIDVEFSSIAKIMKIRGNGVCDDPPRARQGVFSGPGQVRVFRKLNHSKFNLDTPQKEGFGLMPADIINIDGDTSIEIVWANGDRAILIVPKTVGVNEKQLVGSMNLTLASTAYDSGIYTGYQEALSVIRSLTIEKGCTILLDIIKEKTVGKTIGKGLDFVVDIIKGMGKDDNGVTKIILKSKVIIDSAGDEICVYNIEGSPDIKTVKGEEVTLADKEMVAISENGSLSEVQFFDPEEVLNRFYNTVKESVTIKAETASAIERETVKLTVMGVAGDPIRVESSPLSDKVLFKDGIDDTPTGPGFHGNWFDDTIDADGIRRYAVEFNDMGIYRIKVTVTGGDREGDSDTVEIMILEKEVTFDLPAPTPSKLEIAELFTSKSVYPKGEKVKVHYYITNTGTVDVDEYHVEYDIIDARGKTVYENIGGAHSIGAGDENKWHSENWEIPSDARIGPYIINCTLIWGSKRDTAGREFFVTHPATREGKTAKLEISNLYTGKSEYLEGAGKIVDVCYYVKNTGTVDISEYHVIYQIFDSEGKRYCWFISDMFGSIVAGKEDKWQSGVWKVPSDAKVGRYTVDAMVIWGLDRFSRETAYFFVN